MSRERLEWTLSLLDRASGPARKVARGLDAVSAAQARVAKAGARNNVADSLERGLRQRRGARAARIGRELEELVRAQNEVGQSGAGMGAMVAGAFAAIGTAALAAAAAVARVGIALGNAVFEAAQFREQTMASLETMLGSRDTARATFAFAQRAAQLTPFDTREVIDHVRTLTTGGFRGQGLNTALALVSDVQAAMGSEAGTSIGRLLSQINSGRKLQADLLESFQIAGVGREPLFEALARQFNVRATTTAARNTAVERLMRQGRFVVQGDDQRTLVAIRDAITSRFSRGGRAGSGAVAQGAGSLSGAISNAKSAFFDLLSSIDLAETPGLVAVRNALNSITSALNPASAAGRALLATITNLSNRAGALFGSLVGRIDAVAVVQRINQALDLSGRIASYVAERYRALFGPTIALLQRFGPTLLRTLQLAIGPTGASGLASAFQTLARAGGYVLAAFVGVVGFWIARAAPVFGLIAVVVRGVSAAVDFLGASFRNAWQWIQGVFTAVKNVISVADLSSFSGIGRAIVDGLGAGITAAWRGLIERFRTLIGMLPAAVKNALGIRSPSRVFAELGWYSAQGFAVGIEDGASRIRGAVGSMVDVGAVGTRAGSIARAGAGGAPVSLTINVTAPEGSDADEWGAVIASHVARELGSRTERAA